VGKICRCRSRSGKQKYRYQSEAHAANAAAHRGWSVTIYPCPYRLHTFHITHKKDTQGL
jgi:hypothetical protein